MDSTKRNWYLLPLRIIAAIVFLTAVVGKLFDYDSLYAAVSRLGWIPHLLDNTAAITLMVAELTAGVLLLSPRWNRVGGIVGSILSVLFITVTSYLRLSGISDDCACFGIFISLPPLAMLWIDVLLLLACGIVAMGGTAQSGAQRVPTNANRRILPYAVVTYSVLMLSALQIGLARDKERKAHSERPVVNLRFGDSAPRFSFTTNSGRVVTNQTIGGKWTLLCFVMGMCPPCEREVADISASYDTWKSQLDVFLILMDRPLLASAKRAAQNYASRLVKPIPVVTDVDGSIARLFADRPAVSPFSILLDPDGRVRFVQGGREEGEFALTHDINAILKAQAVSAADHYRQRPTFSRPAPDGEVLVNGQLLKLSELWREEPLVLSFMLLDCMPCKRQLDFLERAAGGSSTLQLLYVYPSEAQATQARNMIGVRGWITADLSKSLHTAYQVWNAPSTFVINKGRLSYSADPRNSPSELDRILASLRDGKPAEQVTRSKKEQMK